MSKDCAGNRQTESMSQSTLFKCRRKLKPLQNGFLLSLIISFTGHLVMLVFVVWPSPAQEVQPNRPYDFAVIELVSHLSAEKSAEGQKPEEPAPKEQMPEEQVPREQEKEKSPLTPLMVPEIKPPLERRKKISSVAPKPVDSPKTVAVQQATQSAETSQSASASASEEVPPLRGVPEGEDVEIPARALEQVELKIPAELREQEFRTSVRVRVDVSPSGEGEPSLRTSSGNEAIDELVLAALKQWKWQPATRNGRDIPSTLYFRFLIQVD